MTPARHPAAGARATITTPNDREIRIERIFHASRRRVWDVLTNPTLVSQWWAPGGSTLEIQHMDVRRGGRWRFVEHGAKGADGFGGTYRDVTPPERLMFSFQWDGMPGFEAVQTMTLEDLGDGRTRLVTVVRCRTTEERDGMLYSGMEPAVNRQYDALDRVLAHRNDEPHQGAHGT